MKIGKFFLGAAVLAVVVVGLTAQTGDWRELCFVPNFDSGAKAGASPLDSSSAVGKQDLSAGFGLAVKNDPSAVAPSFADSAEHTGNALLQFRAGGHILGFTPEGVLVASGTHALKIEFIDSLGVKPLSENALSGNLDIEAENDAGGAASAQNETPTLSKVSYPGLWSGITLKYEADASGVAKSTYEIAPGGDPAVIRLKANVPVQIDQNGFLHYGFETGEMIESKPVAWQEIDGQRAAVVAAYRIIGEKEFGFEVGSYDRTLPLVIDPTLTWSTFLGGGDVDKGKGIAVDGSGNIYVAGDSLATWGNPIRAFPGFYDVFVAKLNASGVLLWNTFLGSANYDFCLGIAVTSAGSVYVTGSSMATWGTSPIRAFGGGLKDAFAARLTTAGALQWNTFLGGTGSDSGMGIAVDGSGHAYITGFSDVTWGNPVNPFTANDAFVAELDAAGALLWHTFLGGTGGSEEGHGVAVDSEGHVYVAGNSSATWGTPVNAYSGFSDVFVAEFDGAGARLWNTFLGSTQWDSASSIAVYGTESVYIAGMSYATWGTPIRAYGGGISDAFAAKLNGSGARIWNTFLGSASGFDEAIGIAVDGLGNVYIGGSSSVTWGTPFRAFTAGLDDVFAAMLNANGTLQWNGFLGSASVEAGGSIAADSAGNVFIAGSAAQTWGSPVRLFAGGEDAFAAKITGDAVAPTVTLTSPNGGESWPVGSAHNITWTSTGTMANVKLEYSTDGGVVSWTSIIASTPNDGTHAWTVPNAVSSTCRIRVSDAADGTPSDTSNANFAIVAAPPTVTVTSPNGGESWPAGSVHNITWTSTGTMANVKLEYSTDGGVVSWTSIIASTPNDGTHAWTVPNAVSSTCRVRVSDAADGTPFDTSNANFAIVAGAASTIALSKTSLNFGAERNGTPTPGQLTVLTNSGGGTMNWTATPSVGWLQVDPASGTGDAVLTITVTNTNYPVGTYAGTIAIAATGATNTPQTINVSLKIIASGSDAAPFGNFATPADGSTVTSSVPVTGWVLDDVYVQSVKIYRGTGLSDRIYIGDATFVDGARPDVAKAYSTYPMNYRAGWGYMLLTNFLPSKGNGPFTLLAYAKDSKGHEVLLGSKAIICDNAHAVKPFGAIDTPSQGGTATGASFVNFGWALTPLPDTIAINGSTINVYVDSVPLGHPTYNIYRKDIATAFPGLNNSGGAIGYFYLNTMTMANGVHTIQWSVTDTGGQGDGIGSRYFTVQNLSGGSSEGAEAAAEVSNPSTGRRAEDLSFIPEDRQTPVYLKRGVREDAATEAVYPETEGGAGIAIQPLERIAVYWNENDSFENREESLARARRILFKTDAPDEGRRYEAYQLVAGELRPLPIGASFDPVDGIFYWQPGPGFLGEFQFVVVDTATMNRKTIKIIILGDRS